MFSMVFSPGVYGANPASEDAVARQRDPVALVGKDRSYRLAYQLQL